ncbi:MAG: hypothetical protein ACTSRA_12895 [Promethearchaeota archaeon]
MKAKNILKIKFTTAQVEINNLLAWSGIGSAITGCFLLLIWYALDFIDEARAYLHYAAPLFTYLTLELMLVIGIICITNMILTIIAGILVYRKNETARTLLLIIGITQIFIFPQGTFFGIMMISIYKSLKILFNNEGNETDKFTIDEKTKNTILLFLIFFIISTIAYISLTLPAIYFIPIEFANDEDIRWLRMNFWNVFHAIYLVYGIIAFIIALSGIIALKKIKGWRKLLYLSCFFMLFAIPIGPYISGILYRHFLKDRRK